MNAIQLAIPRTQVWISITHVISQLGLNQVKASKPIIVLLLLMNSDRVLAGVLGLGLNCEGYTGASCMKMLRVS